MSQTRADVIRAFIPASPFARELGIELVDLRPDEAELRLPYEPRLATLGDVVHGGAPAACSTGVSSDQAAAIPAVSSSAAIAPPWVQTTLLSCGDPR